MRRILLLVLALVGPNCGGSGGTTPSVKSNTEEVKSRRDEIQALADVPSDASKEVPKRYGSDKYPETFLIDSQGKLTQLLYQVKWDGAEAALCLENLH